MKLFNWVIFFSLILTSFAFAEEFLEDFPQEIPEEYMDEQYLENIDPEMREEVMANLDIEQIELDDEMIPFFVENFCPMIEPQTAEIIGFQLPKQVPLRNDIFNLYIAENPVAYIEISEDKKVKDFGCGEVSENPTFKVHISSIEIFNEIDEETNYFDFYKDKKKSEDIKIEGVGFGKKLKLFFLNIGIGIAGWFM